MRLLFRAGGPDAGAAPPSLTKRFGALEQFFQTRLVRVPRLAGVDDRDLAALRGFHELRIRPGIDVGDIRLLVLVVGEHPVVDRRAFVAGRAARRLDIGFVGRSFRLGFAPLFPRLPLARAVAAHASC